MMMESDMKPLISKKTDLFNDYEEDGDGDEVSSTAGDYGLPPFATYLFVIFFVSAGIYMAWFTHYSTYQFCLASHIKPAYLLDERCYFIISANDGKPNERLIKKYNGSEISFHIMYLTLTKIRNDHYQTDPQKVLTIIHSVAILAFIVRFYFLSKKSHYVLDYFCIVDSYLFGLAYYFIFKMIQLFSYYFFYFEEDCFQLFL